MADSENRTSKTTHQRWITPGRALAIAKEHFQKEAIAADALGQRLRDGLLKAMAANVITQPRDEPEKVSTYTTLSKAFWQRVAGGWFGQIFWQTGNLEVWTDRGNNRCSVHGLRIDPNGLADFLDLLKDGSPDLEPPPQPDVPSLFEAKPVAPALLAKWAALYVETYPKTEDTLDKAWASAKGMFPGKRVSRDKVVAAVAKLRPRKGGRKPETGE